MPFRRCASVFSAASLTAAVVLGTPPASMGQAMLRAGGFQPNIQPPQGAADDTLSAKESNSGVYVRDSEVALEKMALAERLEHLKEWTKSADVYQEILDKYRDRVVPSHANDDGVVDQYTSVVSKVNEHLRVWPADGLDVYRARYEVTAQNLVKTAKRGDLRPLHEAFARYFVTESGKQAGLKLIDAYYELGEFPAAAWIGQQLLLHPSLGTDQPAVLFRVGLAAHLSGNEKAAQDALAQLQGKFPAALGAVYGKDVVLADELAQLLASVKSVSYAAAGDSWLMPGGDPSRGKVSPAPARSGAKLYGIELPQPNYKQIADVNQRNTLQNQDKSARADGAAMGIMPAIDRGEMFFQDNARLSAVSLDSGVPLPGWAATYASRNGQYVIPDATSLPLGQSFSVTLTDAAVLAVMDQSDPLAVMNGLPEREVRLVCLNRETGKELWTVSPRNLADTNLKALKIGGSPLVVGDNVYIVGRAMKGNGYEDCYVLCFDLGNGAYRWSCYVASAVSTGGAMPVNGMMVPTSANPSTNLSYDSGRLFVSTNVGAVAALDAYNGTIAWLNIYREADEAINPNAMQFGMMGGFNGMGQGVQASSPAPAPWAENAPIVSDGNVFVLPADGKYLLIYDAGSGRLLKKMRKDICCHTMFDEQSSDQTVDKPNMLLGVVPNAKSKDYNAGKPVDLLLLGTTGRIVAIDWKNYSDSKPRGSFVWVSNLTHGNAARSIRGRAFVTTDSVYVPTLWELCRISMSNGKIAESYPPHGAVWSEEEGPGNVVISGDHMVIAGDKRVNVYTDLSLARKNLDQSIADDPADPQPRLRYAEVMFVAHQQDLAIQKLDEAIGLLGGLNALRPGTARDRVFNDALTFATKLAKDGADQTTAVNGLFDRAAAAAFSPSQQVSYRMARARFARATEKGQEQDLPLAVKLYQEILSDDAMRTVPTAEESQDTTPDATPDAASDMSSEGMTQAGLVAEAAIRSIIQGPKGRQAYAPFEQKAKADLDAAEQAHDASKLLAVATVYPNAKVATEAMIQAADVFETQGQPRAATQVLRQIYLKLDDKAVLKVDVLEAMARDYLKSGRTEAAASRLAQAATLAGTLKPDAKLTRPIMLPDGTVLSDMTLARAKDRLRTFIGKEAAANLPDFDLISHATARAYYKTPHQSRKLDPLIDDPAAEILNVGKLLIPASDFTRDDLLATWTSGAGLSIFPVAKNQPLGTNAEFTDEPRGIAWVPGNRGLLAWTGNTLTLLDSTDAKSSWHLDVTTLPALDVMAQATPDIAPQTPEQAMNMQRLQMLQRRGRGAFVRNNLVINGNVGQVVMVGGQVVRLPNAVAGAAAQDVTASGSSGAETITEVRPVSDLALVTTSTGRVLAVDLAHGSVLWQTRVSSHAVDRLVDNDDFTVLKTTDENTVQLIVIDTYSGRLLARKGFSVETGAVPINLALADDGTLVYTMSDRLVIHDLYETGHDRRLDNGKVITISAPQNAQAGVPLAPFAGMSRPDQLLIHAGQILALCDGGKFFRGYDAETHDLIKYKTVVDQEPQIVPMILTTGGGGPDTGLRLGGDYVYAWSAAAVAAYNVNSPDLNWVHSLEGAVGSGREFFVGKDYVLMLNESGANAGAPGADAAPTPGGPPNIPVAGQKMMPVVAPPVPRGGDAGQDQPAPKADADTPACMISAFSRAVLNDKPFAPESGYWDYKREVREPAGILTWEPVEGGLYYLAGDHRLHLLKGSRDSFTAPATQPAP